MIDFQFRTMDGEFYPRLRVELFQDAIDACLFILKDLNLKKIGT